MTSFGHRTAPEASDADRSTAIVTAWFKCRPVRPIEFAERPCSSATSKESGRTLAYAGPVRQEAFNASYYEAMAQVIPVFFLAMVVSRYWTRHEEDSLVMNLVAVLVVLVSVAGEYIAVTALFNREPVSSIDRNILTYAWVFPAGFIVGIALGGPVDAIRHQVARLLQSWRHRDENNDSDSD
jgi:hypothetical protein